MYSDPARSDRLGRETDVETIIVGFSDLHGRWRGKMLPAARYFDSPEAPVQFSDYVFALDRADAVIEPDVELSWWPTGNGGFRDLLLWPEPDTLRTIPWRTRTALVLGQLTYRAGSPFAASPRSILADAGRTLQDQGLTASVAAELEFVLFRAPQHPDDLSSPEPFVPDARVYDVERFETDQDAILPILDGLRQMDFDIDCWSVEGGVSQYEFNWEHGDLLKAADQAFLFKSALRQLARRQGLTASFMAKNDTADLGSSMHIHQSLWTAEGTNVFAGPEVDHGLSETALSYVAGLLETMSDLTCLFAPTVNSYKRYIPGFSAGMNATWGIENPMAGVRAILDGESGTRVEFRPPGADANPYLALAASVHGGIWGMSKQLVPPDPSVGDVSGDSTAAGLPSSLREAAEALRDSVPVRSMLGDTFVDYYSAVCRWEAEQARRAVTDWDRRRYLLGP